MLPLAALARVGERVVLHSPEPVGGASLRYFARALGVAEPPPTFLCETCQLADLARDGAGYAGHHWHLEADLGQGGRVTTIRLANRYRFGAPVEPSTVVTTEWELVAVAEARHGISVTSRATYRDQHDAWLATNDEVMLYRGSAAQPLPARSARPAAAELPSALVWSRALTLTDLVAYGGATWDHHRLHYDEAFARRAGFDGPIVDGQMWGALLAAQALAAQPGARLVGLDIRYLGAVAVPADVRLLTGPAEEVDDPIESVAQQQVRWGDRLVAAATARLRPIP